MARRGIRTRDFVGEMWVSLPTKLTQLTKVEMITMQLGFGFFLRLPLEPWKTIRAAGVSLLAQISLYMFGWCSWLSRAPHTREVPSSILGSNIYFIQESICGRVVKAPDSSSGQLCWREFDPHRMYFFFFFFFLTPLRFCRLFSFSMYCPYGPMDKAPAYGAGDSGFESQYGLFWE